MVLRSLVISLFSVSSLVLLVQEVQGQNPETTIGGIIGTNIGQAIRSAKLAQENMIAFNKEIETARLRYRACDGTCADKDQIEEEFDRLLTSKDFFYAFMRFIQSETKSIGTRAQADLLSGVLGDADGGIPPYAAVTHRLWTNCLEKKRQLGIFIRLPSPGAYQACQDTYLVHKQRRDIHEYYEQPGKREALLEAGSPAAGTPLLEGQRKTVENNILPSGIEGQKILRCVYGPIGTKDDAVILPFEFWYGKVPLTRAELKAQWIRFIGLRTWRDRYLRIPEITLTICPPGDQNALAIYMKHEDPRLFERNREAQRKRDIKVQRNIALSRRNRQEEDVEYNRQINAGNSLLRDAHSKEIAECKDLECRRQASKRYKQDLHELVTSTKNSPVYRGFATQLESFADVSAEINACQNVEGAPPPRRGRESGGEVFSRQRDKLDGTVQNCLQ